MLWGAGRSAWQGCFAPYRLLGFINGEIKTAHEDQEHEDNTRPIKWINSLKYLISHTISSQVASRIGWLIITRLPDLSRYAGHIPAPPQPFTYKYTPSFLKHRHRSSPFTQPLALSIQTFINPWYMPFQSSDIHKLNHAPLFICKIRPSKRQKCRSIPCKEKIENSQIKVSLPEKR
jgi:hypothetical protein